MAFGYKTQFARHNGTSYVQVAGLISVEEAEITRPPVQVTNLDGTTGYHNFNPSPLADGGEISITLEWDQDDTQQGLLKGDLGASTSVQYQVTYPNSKVFQFTGFPTSWGKSIPMEDRITRVVKFKVTGEPTEA